MYVLMYKDEKVMAFDENKQIVYQEKLIPEAIRFGSLDCFLYLRATAFRARETYKALVKTLAAKDYHKIEEVFDQTYGLSLSDVYWIKKEEDPITFASINLYEHDFDQVAARAGYLGDAQGKARLSPEYTTDGQLPKCFVRKNGKIYLYKRGTTWGDSEGREMYSEYYATQVLEALHIPHVPYEIAEYEGQLCSVCPLVTSLDYSYVPIGAFNYDEVHDVFNDFIRRGFGTKIRSMILFDALVYNYDRHIGNFGYLKNNTTLTYDFFPLFDHGNAFFPLATSKDLESLPHYLKKVSYSAMGIPFDALVKQYCGKEEVKLLERLEGFQLHPHPQYGEDVRPYNKFLAFRVQELKEIIHQQ